MNIVIRSDKDLRNNNEGLKEYRHHNFTVKLRAINLLSCEKLRNILIPTVCTTLALYGPQRDKIASAPRQGAWRFSLQYSPWNLIYWQSIFIQVNFKNVKIHPHFGCFRWCFSNFTFCITFAFFVTPSQAQFIYVSCRKQSWKSFPTQEASVLLYFTDCIQDCIQSALV